MYLLLDTDDTYSVTDSPTSPTISSHWWSSPSIAIYKYFDDPHAANGIVFYPDAEVISHFTDVKSYDDFLLLYPEFQI